MQSRMSIGSLSGGGGGGSGGITAPGINAPSNLIATVVSDAAIDLTWDDNSTTETGYQLQRDVDPSFPSPTTINIAANAESYSDSGLDADTTYYYRIRAVGVGYSSFTNIDATTDEAPPFLNIGGMGSGLSVNRFAPVVSTADMDPNTPTQTSGHRKPLLRKLKTPGAYILVFEALANYTLDYSSFAIQCKVTTDYGISWGPVKTIYQENAANVATQHGPHVSLMSAVVDINNTGKIFVSYGINQLNDTATGNLNSGNTVKSIHMVRSKTDGSTWEKLDGTAITQPSPITASWTKGTDITSTCTVIGNAPTGHGFGTVSATITGTTNATPVVVTTSGNHNLINGMKTRVSGCDVSANNGDWIVGGKTPTTFQLVGSTAPGSAGTTGTVKLMWGQVDGYGSGYCLDDGSLIMPMRHTWAVDGATAGGVTVWGHFIFCADPSVDNEVWSLSTSGGRGGLDDSDGSGHPSATANTDAGSTECSVIQMTDVNKTLYATWRVAGKSFERGSGTSTDRGKTWTALADDSAGTKNLTGDATGSGLCYLPGSGRMILSRPASTDYRMRGTIAYSDVNSGSVWTHRIIHEGYFGYSQLEAISDDEFLVVWEGGHDGTTPLTMKGFECIFIRKINLSWLTDTADADDVLDLPFNDDGGSPTNPPITDFYLNSYGKYFHDRGVGDIRASGGILTAVRAAASNIPFTTKSGVKFGIPFRFSDGAMHAVVPRSNESMTWEIILIGTSDNNAMLFTSSKDDDASSVAGVSIYITATGKLAAQFTKVAGGTVHTRAASTNNVFSGAVNEIVHIAVVRDAANSLMLLYINGVLEASVSDGTVASSLANGTDPTVAQPAALGGTYDNTEITINGTSAITAPSGLLINHFRRTRKAVAPGSMMTITTPRDSASLVLPTPRGWTIEELPLVGSALPDVSNLQAFFYPTFNQGYSMRYGNYGNGPVQLNPPNGTGGRSNIDLGAARWQLHSTSLITPDFWITESLGSQPTFPSYKTYCYEFDDLTVKINAARVIANSGGNVTPNFEYIWETGIFTIGFDFNWDGSGGNQFLFGSLNPSFSAGVGKVGLECYINSGEIYFTISNNSGTPVIDVGPFAKTFTANTWYSCMLTCNGSGKVNLWWKAITGDAVTLGTGDKVQSSGNIATLGTNDMSNDLHVLEKAAGSSSFNGKLKNLRFHNVDITVGATDVSEWQKWFNLDTYY